MASFDIIKKPEGQNQFSFFGYCKHPQDDDNWCLRDDECKWGCMNKDGNILIDAIYDCFRIVNGYILAGRNGEIFRGSIYANEFGEYNGVYDLYSPQGELLIGGFDKLEYDSQNDVFLLLFGGEWELEKEYNYADFEDYDLEYHFKEKNGRWLIVDKNLCSLIRSIDGSDCFFEKGAINTITKVISRSNVKKTTNTSNNNIFQKIGVSAIQKGKNDIQYYWSFPLELFSKSKPEISHGIAVIKRDWKKEAIRISDRVCSQKYNEIIAVDDNVYIAGERSNGITHVGLFSFEKKIIGFEEEFIFLTFPVKGIVFGVKSDKEPSEDDMVKLVCVDTTKESLIQYTAIESISFIQLVWAMEKGGLELITHSEEQEGGQLYVRNVDLFDASFIECFPYRIIQDEQDFIGENYWYSDVYELKYSEYEKEQDRIESARQNERENPDYLGETWNAMTDGMYGDMPDGFSGDFGFRG